MKNALGAAYSSIGNKSLWMGPSPAIAKPVRCEASWRTINASGELMLIISMSLRTRSMAKPLRKTSGPVGHGCLLPRMRISFRTSQISMYGKTDPKVRKTVFKISSFIS